MTNASDSAQPYFRKVPLDEAISTAVQYVADDNRVHPDVVRTLLEEIERLRANQTTRANISMWPIIALGCAALLGVAAGAFVIVYSVSLL